MAVHGVRVGLATDAPTCGCLGGIFVSEEVREGRGGVGWGCRWVKCTRDDMTVGELKVIEGEDV